MFLLIVAREGFAKYFIFHTFDSAMFLLLRETACLFITGHGFNRKINAAVLTLQPDRPIWPETISRHVALIHGTSLKTFRLVLIISNLLYSHK